jgi:predicted nucleic acid-binding protein
MIVVDTSALISLAVGDALEPVLTEFDVITTQVVREELKSTAEYDDRHGAGAATVLDADSMLRIVETHEEAFETSRIDAGEGSCVAVAQARDADFFVTDDYRALPELQQVVDAEVVLSPIVLRALVKRGVWSEQRAKTAFEAIAAGRDWLGAPIYRHARTLFADD